MHTSHSGGAVGMIVCPNLFKFPSRGVTSDRGRPFGAGSLSLAINHGSKIMPIVPPGCVAPSRPLRGDYAYIAFRWSSRHDSVSESFQVPVTGCDE